MKKLILALLVFTSSYNYAQSVNDYKAVIIPLQYKFLKSENQYRLNTATKFNLTKAGFVSFYKNENLTADYSDRCSLLYADVEKEGGFLITKLYLTLKDCNDKVIFKSIVGKSKEKDFQLAYMEALNQAFQSVYALRYKYSGVSAKSESTVIQEKVVNSVATTQVQNTVQTSNVDLKDSNLLYAQATPTGFQLIDSTPKVVMKLMKTSQPNSFIAIRDSVQGSLILQDNHWYFEYYQNDELISEKVAVKF
ncbi:MAG: hypothetical protein I4O51_09365 [Flavobacterium micromati]|nr:hypothetical protein [Flavobacterium micromati]